jgi:hypothetical protein
MIDLGFCNRTDGGARVCSGRLCVRRGDDERPVVACMVCGWPQEDHPVTQEMREAEANAKKAPTVNSNYPAQDYAVTWLQRIQTLEKQRAVDLERMDRLEMRLAALEEATPVESRGKRR